MIGPIQVDSATGLWYRIRKTNAKKYKSCLVLLHGVGSNESSMFSLSEGIPEDVLVVFVRGSLTLGPESFAWFQVVFAPNGPAISPEQAEHSRSLLIQFLSELNKAYVIQAHQTMIAGFSQGGIMSASLALTSPESVCGFGLLSGRILPEILPLLASGERLAELNGFVSHGIYDDTLPVDWAHKSHGLLNQLGVRHHFKLYSAKHTITPPMHADFLEWISIVGR